MQGAFNVVCLCLALGAVKAEASQVLSAPLYLANYASSYNSHVVNHDIRYPVVAAAAAVQTPVVTNQFVAAPLVTSRFAPVSQFAAAPVVTNQLIASGLAPVSQLVPSAVPAAPVVTNQLIASRLAPVSQLVPSAAPVVTNQLVASRLAPAPPAPGAPAPLNLPVAPAVEVTARSGAQKRPSPNPPAPEQLSRSTQVNSEPARPETNPVPNSLLAASQFLARQFSQQQQQQQQQPSSAEAPQARPRFLVAGNALQNTEKLNGDDSESVEVNSAESVETPSAPNAPKLPPPAEGPKARIVFSPVSVLRSPVVPSPYTQLISF